MSDICLMQFHIAATMKIDNNIIVSDHTKLKNICKSGINLYKKFCLKEKLGYFTTKSLKDEYNYKNATYTQVSTKYVSLWQRSFVRHFLISTSCTIVF